MSEENEVRPENNDSPQATDEQREQHHQRRRSKQRGSRPPQSSSSETALNLSELRELAELINEQGFTDFEFENEKIRVRLRRELAPQIIQTSAAPTSASNAPAPVQQTASTKTETALPQTETPISEDDNLHKINSPIVGTFYRSPSPEADSFVKVGSKVSAESVVCIIEAMKLMNEILAETSGEIVKIYVENGQPVEYGQPLFAVKK